MKNICIYCGSSRGVDDAYATVAAALGKRLAEDNFGVVYGGASRGIMGIIADAALEAGGQVTGVIPQALVDMEVAHHGLSEMHVVASMHDRKTLMADLSDGFIALPGGYGTLEEIVEMLTWAQLRFHTKPCALLNINSYYDHLLAYFEHAASQGFLRDRHRDMLLVADTVDDVLKSLKNYVAPEIDKLSPSAR